ncbi:hypothetical protein MGG_10448 [Pyricularia oryzae 70-15]|uniref:ENTH domain-containing protein n=1 Tax=Pyricularia oryzae (strain 70-15 / ATCC MYA-4617 / FGSC 8958) TaxID=242507 RepID=G4MY15_PYRO7|nr:uncharacterized protein MGG_10448 [Pyricularia oryzae 70-15]EHA53543.1 hypothetical protein MGG_10448 [Pyricularia oryzae 70-15]KAI7913529.1 hypothetical protein M9X92_009395 [Pyricularia oryzae]KAI7914260.1 hypothetical protein M0657_009583 [Pyricularia oryzae]
MDWNDLKSTVSNLTLYDVKAGVRKVQNAVMNYTEMESKVREATNNEPWGASSSLMQEIANGTFNYQTLNEIMPMIYRRFTEKTAEEWRQIYKALQLLEFLIKHGSERVIDDARSHLTLLKMLRQFHYIDQNGKDQGINVRNRAKELAELLGDVDRIRAERKKARANKAKYTGVEGGAGGFSSGSGGRFGGFGSESGGYGGSNANYGGYSGGVYGDGGGFGGQTDDWRGESSSGGGGGGSSSRADQFEEYDEFDEGEKKTAASSSSGRAGVKRTTGGSSSSSSAPKKAEPPKKKEPEVDLFSFDEPETTSVPAPTIAPSSSSGLAALSSANDDDDDFDDFQSAAPVNSGGQPLAAPMTSNASSAQFAAPKPVSAPQQANLGNMVGLSSISPTPASSAISPPPAANYSSLSTPLAATPSGPPKPTGYSAAQPNYFTSVQAGASQSTPSLQSRQSASSVGFGASTPMSSTSASLGAPKPSAAAKPAGGDAFGSLWSQASVGVKKPSTPSAGPAMGQLAKEKSAAGIWGAPATAGSSAGANKPAGGSSQGGAMGDLLG